MKSRQLSSIFKHDSVHNPSILSLLENTTIGTNGAKYRHLHTAQKINALHSPHYFTIYRHEKAIANITICERPILFGDGYLVETFYIRYFAFDTNFQTKKQIKNRNKSTIFQTYISNLLTTSNLDIESPKYDPKIYWAIVDPENNRSLQMSEKYDFECITHIKTTAFSRFTLRQKKNVSLAKKKDHHDIFNMIRHFYTGYNGLTDIHLFNNNDYFVLKENDEIVAGIKASKVEWRIERLPGIMGQFLARILPYTPFLRRIINPNKYQFLATEGLFWKEGYAHQILPLLEGVLFEQGCHSMLLWTDVKNEKVNRLLSSINLGLLQKIKADNEVNLMAKFNNVSDKTKETFKKRPHYILGFDCT